MSQSEDIKQAIEELKAEIGPPRILIIDDDPNCVEFFKREMSGCEIVSCSTGEQGLKLLEQDQNFDAVVVDEKLPGMEGHEVVAEINQRWPTLSTALSSGAPIDPFLLGLSLPIPKPLRTEDLQRLLGLVRKWRNSINL